MSHKFSVEVDALNGRVRVYPIPEIESIEEWQAFANWLEELKWPPGQPCSSDLEHAAQLVEKIGYLEWENWTGPLLAAKIRDLSPTHRGCSHDLEHAGSRAYDAGDYQEHGKRVWRE